MGRIFMRATPDADTVTNNTVAGGIDAAKVAAGTVNNTEFGYLNGVSSSIQTQLNGKQATLPTFTSGQVLFGDGDNTPTASGNFYFTDASSSLFVKNNTPIITLNASINYNPFGFAFQYNSSGRFLFGYQENTSLFYIRGTDTNGNFVANPAISCRRGSSNNVGINLPGGTAPLSQLTVNGNAFIGANGTATASVHVKAGTTAAGSAPIKLTAGPLMTTPEDGAFEYDGSNLYFTVGSTRKIVTLI